MPGGFGARGCLGLGIGFGIRGIMLALIVSCWDREIRSRIIGLVFESEFLRLLL